MKLLKTHLFSFEGFFSFAIKRKMSAMQVQSSLDFDATDLPED